MTKKSKKRDYKNKSKVLLIFSTMVFFVLMVTMVIVGFLMYLMFNREVINMTDVDTIWFLGVFFFASSIIIGTLISFGMGSIVLKEADKVVEGMQNLTRGEYEVRVSPVKSGFSKELVDNFNMLADELENTQSLKSDFINDFAHEFKTPIVSISGFAKVLKKDNLTKEQRLEYLNVIEEEAERLSLLSTNALNFTKVEKQNILSGESTFNLAEQIRTCLLLLEKKWTTKELDLNVDLEETAIFANEEMLKQVWINLLDNAIKFADKKTPLYVSLKNVKNGVVFSVKNKGIDITEEEKEKIFNRFYRTKMAKGIEGNGVGLAIVKKIVNLHNGLVDVDCVEGFTEFRVTLPVSFNI